MGIYATKSRFQTMLAPVVSLLVARNISADAVTLSAVALSALAGCLLAISREYPPVLFAVPLLLVARLLLNVLDGMVARAANTARATGELLNEFGDRVSDLLIFAGLAWASDMTIGWIAISLILLSSYTDILGKSLTGRRTYGGVMAKGDRMMVVSLFALIVGASSWLDSWIVGWLDGWFVCWTVLAVGAVVTTVQRLRAIVHLVKGGA